MCVCVRERIDWRRPLAPFTARPWPASSQSCAATRGPFPRYAPPPAALHGTSAAWGSRAPVGVKGYLVTTSSVEHI